MSISEGKLAIILNFSGLNEQLKYLKTKALVSPSWPLDIAYLEFYIKKLKSLGQYAVKKFGKNYDKKREPILLFIQCNERDIDNIDKFLVAREYFNYQGIICFATVRKRPHDPNWRKLIFKTLNFSLF